MIPASELRVGNWAYSNITKEYFKVSQLILDQILTCDPIPLTHEILEKCGFVYHKSSGAGGQDEWAGMGAWSKPDNGFLFGWLFRGSVHPKRSLVLHLVGYFNTQIQYLHQLQNIYFALTGTELTINL